MKTKRVAQLVQTPPAAAVVAGVARRDITPPPGIYVRMWGAAKHDIAEGVHRPLTATALAIRESGSSPPLVLLSLDLPMLGGMGSDEDEKRVLTPFLQQLGLDRSRVIVNCTHTHAAPWAATARAAMPGGHLIGPYLDQIGRAILEAASEAIDTAVPATMTWATGRCSLAANRDFPDPNARHRNPRNARVIVGYNPLIVADDALVVGRVTRDSDDAALATIANYACHPTTLAWLNKLISPDFVGAMRETVERHTGSAPCLFLQGASGELAPAHQYVGDGAVADKHGRQLGFAVLSALESMLSPRQRLAYQGITESGAPLGVWLPESFAPSPVIKADSFLTPLPLKKMPSPAELEKQIAATKDRALRERLFRKLQIVKALGPGKTYPTPTWVWRIGAALFIAHPNEAYSIFQRDLRAAFPGNAVVVMNVSGTELGYVHPPELCNKNIYPVWQSPFDRGALPLLTKLCRKHARSLLGSITRTPTPRRSKRTGRNRTI